jgi:hypothetical protein
MAAAMMKQAHGCIGCGVPTADPERVCTDCRHTDRIYGTRVSGYSGPEHVSSILRRALKGLESRRAAKREKGVK